MNERVRGSVFAEEAYAQGKMLDHSSWQRPRDGDRPLPRSITPSDADMTVGEGLFSSIPAVFDNRGNILFCELSSHAREWKEIQPGQLRLYEGLLRGNPHCAVLCRHSVRPERKRKIDTRYDIESFHVRIFDHGFIELPVVDGNQEWQSLVLRWYENPVMMRRTIIAKYVKLILGKDAA